VIELHMPALRERPGDVVPLAEQMLARIAAHAGTPPPALLPGARAALETYGFPGNVRELENVLERAVALSDGGSIDAEDLYLPEATGALPSAVPAEPAPPLGDPQPAPAAPTGQALEDYLGDLERQAILKALEETRWNRTAAARKLGMTLRSLRYRLAKLGIE
jgi:two-component system response regulator PilR (NtrC family)